MADATEARNIFLNSKKEQTCDTCFLPMTNMGFNLECVHCKQTEAKAARAELEAKEKEILTVAQQKAKEEGRTAPIAIKRSGSKAEQKELLLGP